MMKHGLLAFHGAFAAVVIAALLAPIPAAAQSGLAAVEKAAAALAPKGWTPPRTPDGQPDLQGIWTNGFITPVERPPELAGKPFFTKEEALAFEQHKVINRDSRSKLDSESDVKFAYNEAWWDFGTHISKTLQTSLVVDPPDGKIPALTAEAQKKAAMEKQATLERCARPGAICLDATNATGVLLPTDGPEDRSYMERCISWGQAGPPMMPSGYNNNYQVVQVPGYVLVFVESMHEARVIPLDGRPHLPPDVRQLMGDPRGHWEGNTLVVDSTNFSDDTKVDIFAARFRYAGRNMHLIERFTRTDPDTLLYEYTLDDPTTFANPWSVAIPMASTKDKIFEYECNEGNVGLAGILRGARVAEKKAEEAAAAKTANK
jgi:hypothetical protein